MKNTETILDKNFGTNIDKVDIQEIGNYYIVPVKDLTQWEKKKFKDKILDDTMIVSAIELEDLSNTDNAKYFDYSEVDFEDFISLLSEKKYSNYLVILENSKWNNASGYKFFNKFGECFMRSYHCSMYITGASKTGKILQLKEYSHDCPMGHNSYIIGLTEQEYKNIKDKDIDKIIKWGLSFKNRIYSIKKEKKKELSGRDIFISTKNKIGVVENRKVLQYDKIGDNIGYELSQDLNDNVFVVSFVEKKEKNKYGTFLVDKSVYGKFDDILSYLKKCKEEKKILNFSIFMKNNID